MGKCSKEGYEKSQGNQALDKTLHMGATGWPESVF